MKRLVFLLIFSALTAFCARAQTTNPEHQEIAQALEKLVALGQAGDNRAVLEGAELLRKRVEDTRNFTLLEQFYALRSTASFNLKLTGLHWGSRFHTAILRMRAYGPHSEETALALAHLAILSGQNGRDGEMQIAAAQALGAMAAIKRVGTLPPRLAQYEHWMHNLLGEHYARLSRPELAVLHFKVLLTLAGNTLKPEQRDAIARKIAAQERLILWKVTPHIPGSCVASPALTQARAAECLRHADHAQLDGDLPLARAILLELTRDATPDAMPATRIPAAMRLYMLSVMTLAPDAPELLAITEILGHKLAVLEHPSAALMTMYVLADLNDKKRLDMRFIKLAGHVARRAARNSNETLALRLLDAQSNLLFEAMLRENDAERAMPLRLEGTLTLLDAASFAELNGYDGLSQTYTRAALSGLETLTSQGFETLEARLKPYQDATERGVIFPSAAAATELLGRVAATALHEPGRSDALLRWIVAESSLRDNQPRAAGLLKQAIAFAQNTPGMERFHAELLGYSVRFLEDPLTRIAVLRRGYELLFPLPSSENLRADLLLKQIHAYSLIGEHEMVEALVAEMQAIADSFPALETRHRSDLRLRQAAIHLRRNDIKTAFSICEDLLVELIQTTPEKSPLRVMPAQMLANLLAHDGQMERAKTLYEKFVFPVNANPLVVGEGQALLGRLTWLDLEAQFAPKPNTAQELDALLSLADRVASRDEVLKQDILRAQSMAHYGLNAPLLALEAGRKALALGATFASDKTSERQDRTLLETLVGAGVMAAGR